MTIAKGLDAVKAATWALHTQAERSGIIADIIAGRAGRIGVALLLRNLLPVYQVLDASSFATPALERAAAITADLRVLSLDAEPPLLPQALAYADRVHHAVQGNGAELIAHAYVRYLGDLNGGQILKRRLLACLGDTASKLKVLDYPMLANKAHFTHTYRERLDRSVRAAGADMVAREALVAFQLNIALSEAIQAWCAQALESDAVKQ